MNSSILEVGQVDLLSVQVDQVFCESCGGVPKYGLLLVDVVKVTEGRVSIDAERISNMLKERLGQLSSAGWKHEAGKFYCPNCCEAMGRPKKDCGCPDCGGSLLG